MSRKQRILVLVAGIIVGVGVAARVVTSLPERDHAMPSPAAGTSLVAADRFDTAGEAEGGPAGLGWRLVDSDPAVKAERRGGEFHVGGRVSRFTREPDGLRTRRFSTGDFDVRVRVRLTAMSGTGAKEAFLEARAKVGDTLTVYMSPKEVAAERDADRSDGRVPEGAEAKGFFAAMVNSSDTEQSVGYGNLNSVRHILRLTYEAASGKARAYVDGTLIKEATLKIPEPRFTIGIASPDESRRFAVAFDDFELYRSGGE